MFEDTLTNEFHWMLCYLWTHLINYLIIYTLKYMKPVNYSSNLKIYDFYTI